MNSLPSQSLAWKKVGGRLPATSGDFAFFNRSPSENQENRREIRGSCIFLPN
jgi:hypothetical protein